MKAIKVYVNEKDFNLLKDYQEEARSLTIEVSSYPEYADDLEVILLLDEVENAKEII